MITIVISALFAISFAISWFFKQFDIAVLSLQIIAVYAFCCAFDAAIGLMTLGRSLEGTIKNRSARSLTFVGRIFASYQELLNFKVNSNLSSQNPEQATQTRTPQPEKEESLQSFMHLSLEQLYQSFTPVAASILYFDHISRNITVEQKGFRGKRFEQQLKLIFSDYFNAGQQNWFNIQDTLVNSFPSEDFSAVGMRFFVSTPFDRFSVKGVLCLAFESERRPDNSVLESLQFFAKDLERELGTLKNILELQSKVEIAEEKSEQRSRFLTEVSHDIRSPLNNVKAILSILKDDLKAVKDGEVLIETAVRNCDQADLLLESLIDFAKYRAGKLLAKKADFNLSDVVEEVVRAHSFNASMKSLSLSLTKPDQTIYCHADKTQILRVVNNLLANAIKYTDTGTVSVSIAKNNEGNCSVRIADSGCGMTEDQLKQLFTPFVRFQTADNNGTGLGLALSKVLVEANSGQIELRSEPGLGTVFVVTLAAAQSYKSETEAVKNSNIVHFPHNVQLALAGLNILVVDDDVDAADSLSRYLVGKGANCIKAFSAKQAIDILQEKDFEVVVTDCNMPGAGGTQIVDHASKLKSRPVIIVVSGDLDKASQLIDLGASCAMQKPLDLMHLQEYLHDLFFTYKSNVIGA